MVKRTKQGYSLTVGDMPTIRAFGTIIETAIHCNYEDKEFQIFFRSSLHSLRTKLVKAYPNIKPGFRFNISFAEHICLRWAGQYLKSINPEAMEIQVFVNYFPSCLIDSNLIDNG